MDRQLLSLRAEYQRLMAEVELLRDEVTLLRGLQTAHVCAPPWQAAGPGYYWGNTCGGAACAPQVLTLNPQAAPLTFTPPGTAACAPSMVFTVPVAGCG